MIMQDITHYIPIVTTVIAIAFAITFYGRWRRKPVGVYLLWWAIGGVAYGAGTLCESLTTLFGWHIVVFKLWYIVGALLGGAPLAQGTIYLMLPRKTANILTIILVVYVAIASVFIALSPVNTALVQQYELSGKVFAWSWVRDFSPLTNTYALVGLAGGAILSALQYRKQGAHERVWGNVLIAVGAILPGIGGSFTRLGHVEVLYVTEIIGILTIWVGAYLVGSEARLSIHSSQRAANS